MACEDLHVDQAVWTETLILPETVFPVHFPPRSHVSPITVQTYRNSAANPLVSIVNTSSVKVFYHSNSPNYPSAVAQIRELHIRNNYPLSCRAV